MKLLQLEINWRLLVFYAFAGVTVVQLFYYWWFFRRLAFFLPRKKEKSQQHPISVIVCARDQAAKFNATMTQLHQQRLEAIGRLFR